MALRLWALDSSLPAEAVMKRLLSITPVVHFGLRRLQCAAGEASLCHFERAPYSQLLCQLPSSNDVFSEVHISEVSKSWGKLVQRYRVWFCWWFQLKFGENSCLKQQQNIVCTEVLRHFQKRQLCCFIPLPHRLTMKEDPRAVDKCPAACICCLSYKLS